MKIKGYVYGIALLALSTNAFADNFTYLKDKFPFLSVINNMTEEGVDIATAYPYVNEAYKSNVITDKHILHSMEQQEKMLTWMKENPSSRYVIVNIPAYEIYVATSINPEVNSLSDYFIEWESNVVVGSSYHKTPQTPFEIISLKYNPTWTPTKNIMKRNARNEDGSWNWKWIESHNFSPYLRSTREPISWEQASELPLEDILMIEPKGDTNSLGKIKFETTSTQNIYLHDTNEKWFFNEENRARSSGCVRVSNPERLASILLGNEVDYVEGNIAKNETFWEPVSRVPVYFLYDNIEYKVDGNEELRVLSDPYKLFKKFTTEMTTEYTIE